MKGGFTLIEILVSVTILALISGGALIYLNNFNSRQNLEKIKGEVVSALKLSQSYAKTRQLPLNSVLPELNYVQVKINVGNIEARANADDGPTYFSTKISNKAVTVTNSPEIIYFWAGDGKLSDVNGNFYGVGQSASVSIVNNFETEGSYLVTINALGQVSETKYAD